MTPEQEVLEDLLLATRALIRSVVETQPLMGQPPSSEQAFEAMTSVQRVASTALLKEFEQLQGTLHSLFRAMLRMLGIRLKGLYPLDIGNHMVELGVIDEPERWVTIVKLRNELVHEYPLGSTERFERVVAALTSIPFLTDAAARAERVIADRHMLEPRS